MKKAVISLAVIAAAALLSVATTETVEVRSLCEGYGGIPPSNPENDGEKPVEKK